MTSLADSPAAPPLRLKIAPLLVVAALGFAIPYAGAYLAVFAIKLFHWSVRPGANVAWVYVQHAGQLLVALLAIAIMKRLVPADYGLHWPRAKTYIAQAILWGAIFAAVMTVVDYAPQLIAGARPPLDYSPTRSNVMAWLFFEGIYVGPTEEIPFRSLLVTYLAATMPGKLRLGRFEMNWAGVIVALIFALLHATSFFTRNWLLAVGQQVYAFVGGVLYAYWLEKSKSIVGPIIGHNVSDMGETLLVFLWRAL